MKLLVFCLLIVIYTVSASERGCYSQVDCPDGYCCTGGISEWRKGVCRKMAKEGELCDPYPPSTAKYYLRCPCVEGLKCVKTEEVVSTKSPVCVRE
ncbi:U9-ctenitoxin-Pr1a-like isoform X1 [Stegodyphus dumicola]|uniref:U9-ctenitoxin-Pr1a-like isoform X1 n=1 Tax=Stegodyphus dumicola TaxID=202533 RepID=UPI0015AB98C6|nr:U9-ctenitoxin-Pr1a-like isoform X1 [Stegodyphus dumicola]